MLRKHGVVGKFVEFYGPGLAELPLADRATIANMSPEYGATCGIFPVDAETLHYLRLTGRADEHVELVEAYAREQGLFAPRTRPKPTFTDTLELDLATVEPSIAGPKRPQDRVAARPTPRRPSSGAAAARSRGRPDRQAARRGIAESVPASDPTGDGAVDQRGKPRQASTRAATALADRRCSERRDHGARVDATAVVRPRPWRVVIAAITSCTNTSNPSVMIAAGLLAKKAVEKRPRRASPG